MKLACEQVRENLSLMLYGELPFTEEEAVWVQECLDAYKLA